MHRISDLLRSNRDIIINTDIDGILSGMLLTRYCDCQVVGFSNSSDIIWLAKSYKGQLSDPVYVDMYVALAGVRTIDQHIIAIDAAHASALAANPNKINPNLENVRTFLPASSYYLKYPFGTFHYICAKLANEGIPISLPPLNQPTPYGFNIGDLLLRADDAMRTTLASSYSANASSWWEWLEQLSGGCGTVQDFRAYLGTKTSSDAINASAVIAKWFKNVYHCDSNDGGFSKILQSDQKLRPELCAYIGCIEQIMGCALGLNLKETYLTCSGSPCRVNCEMRYRDEFVNQNTIGGRLVFSYAFVKSPISAENFSLTFAK